MSTALLTTFYIPVIIHKLSQIFQYQKYINTPAAAVGKCGNPHIHIFNNDYFKDVTMKKSLTSARSRS